MVRFTPGPNPQGENQVRKGFFVLLAAPLLFFLFVLAINLPDARETRGIGRPVRPGPAALATPEYFHTDRRTVSSLLWTFAEAPGIDIRSTETRQRIGEMARADLPDGDYRRKYYQWQNERRDIYRRHWKNFSLYFPRKPDEDPCDYFSQRRAEILNLKTRIRPAPGAVLLLLETKTFIDFTLPGRDFPLNNLILINNSCRLFLAGNLIERHGWPVAGSDRRDRRKHRTGTADHRRKPGLYRSINWAET